MYSVRLSTFPPRPPLGCPMGERSKSRGFAAAWQATASRSVSQLSGRGSLLTSRSARRLAPPSRNGELGRMKLALQAWIDLLDLEQTEVKMLLGTSRPLALTDKHEVTPRCGEARQGRIRRRRQEAAHASQCDGARSYDVEGNDCLTTRRTRLLVRRQTSSTDRTR